MKWCSGWKRRIEKIARKVTSQRFWRNACITPWNVEGLSGSGLNYDRVRTQFRSQPISSDILDVLQQRVATNATSRNAAHTPDEANAACCEKPVLPHHYFTRSIAFSHRDFDVALKKDSSVYIYTGRGPSQKSLHLGHIVPLELTKYLMEHVYPHAALVLQLTNDEKYLFRDISLTESEKLARENLKDILAVGLDPSRVFAFTNTSYIKNLYPTALRIQKNLTVNTVRNTFGFTDNDNVGKLAFPALQAAPCFPECFPDVLPRNISSDPSVVEEPMALVACAIDQDPFFVLTRRISGCLGKKKPGVIHTTFVPALKGCHLKMSSSNPENGVIELMDNENAVQKKIKSAVSGGCKTLSDFQRSGGNKHTDVSYNILKYVLRDEDTYTQIGKEYCEGGLSSGALKNYVSDAINKFLKEWKERRSQITEDTITQVMTPRRLT